MTGGQVFFTELVLGHGVVLAWAIWEIVSLRRSQKRDRDLAAERARHPEGEHRPDEG